MKKLIHFDTEGFLKCDNPECGYEITEKPEGKEMKDFIDCPVPNVGKTF